ncbi:putative membrane protein YphA (DoxX/SURF4 family) [Chryseobacterium rhizosphaerae]|uniref:Membrane protein YphA (DoxX/SURF4 family) n=1 Tax=Chryseobacterium rhizosphaerae TaxID=395937 RepID=A0AAE4C4I2_9FLAO|nr:DoxX family membrane protein [Chryseobacterium rhizosphaerae]MDR6527614.1 putative membrane protein YphA (DoxX/SURF4 family) [Chryseobacterium rhizosphaerae]
MKFANLRTNRINQWIIIHLRYLVGFAFFPSGLTKLIGNRFTRISTENPIGYFFEALYQSGFYWNFLGWAQVTAGILLLTQRYATLGALVFFAILTNIWVITLSLSFSGTWMITSLMMLAVSILLIWDGHKLLPIFNYNKSSIVKEYPDPGRIWIIAGMIYAFSFIVLYMLDPVHGAVYEKWLTKAFTAIILLSFATSNYKAYKNRKIVVNT